MNTFVHCVYGEGLTPLACYEQTRYFFIELAMGTPILLPCFLRKT